MVKKTQKRTYAMNVAEVKRVNKNIERTQIHVHVKTGKNKEISLTDVKQLVKTLEKKSTPGYEYKYHVVAQTNLSNFFTIKGYNDEVDDDIFDDYLSGRVKDSAKHSVMHGLTINVRKTKL